jgi:hypothetical protein
VHKRVLLQYKYLCAGYSNGNLAVCNNYTIKYYFHWGRAYYSVRIRLCINARTHTHTRLHLRLLHIPSLHRPCNADVMQFWCMIDFPYCLWLSDDKIMVSSWNLKLNVKGGHIWILIALREKRSWTFRIWNICSACYCNSFWRANVLYFVYTGTQLRKSDVTA